MKMTKMKSRKEEGARMKAAPTKGEMFVVDVGVGVDEVENQTDENRERNEEKTIFGWC